MRAIGRDLQSDALSSSDVNLGRNEAIDQHETWPEAKRRDSNHPFHRMLAQHYVRVGLLGSVGRFAAADRRRYARGARVVCRTSRGLEVGEVLSSADQAGEQSCDGTLLRRVTVEDDLLIARLEKNRDQAYQACTLRLAERGSSAV